MKTHNNYTCLSIFVALLLLTSGMGMSHAANLYFIDAHSQLDHEVMDPELVIQRMDEHNVYRTILAARSGRQPDEITGFADRHPLRIIPAVRTKSGAYSRNHPKYYNKMRNQLRDRRFRAMAELLLFHAQKGDKADEVIVFPDDDRARFAFSSANKNNWPFVIHIEFSSLRGAQRARFMQGMRTLLEDSPQQAVVLNHLGQLGAAELGSLLTQYPNLHVLTAHANPGIILQSNQPWTNMFSGNTLSPEWKALVIRHPNRFIFALDNVWARHWNEYYSKQMAYWKTAMADLPAEVAHAVAHGNAERLWRLDPRPEGKQ